MIFAWGLRPTLWRTQRFLRLSLLDEPGLSLHGQVQEDPLRLIDQRLALKHQVLCTAHPPFMFDLGNLQCSTPPR